MNCAVHTDIPAAAFCRTCGKALCENCKRDVMGAIYCEPCIAARLQGTSGAPAQPFVPVAAVHNAPSPGIAMLLGFIPGVGAMYNGQFAKAFVHVVIFVLLIMATNSISGMFGPLIAFWVIYMAFDSYKTAQAKMLGLPLPDPLGLDRIFGIQEHQPTTPPAFTTSASAASVPGASVPPPPSVTPGVYPAEGQPPAGPPQSQAPVGAIVLIALGVFFLLGNILNLHRLWPLFLIAVGLWIAYKHTIMQRT